MKYTSVSPCCVIVVAVPCCEYALTSSRQMHMHSSMIEPSWLMLSDAIHLSSRAARIYHGVQAPIVVSW